MNMTPEMMQQFRGMRGSGQMQTGDTARSDSSRDDRQQNAENDAARSAEYAAKERTPARISN